MEKLILVLNCGSSSLKFAIINPDNGDEKLSGIAALDAKQIKWKAAGEKHQNSLSDSQANHAAVIDFINKEILAKQPELLDALVGVGHRIVHGGESFTKSVKITDQVVASIKEAVKFAPLHNPAGLLGIEAINSNLPHLKDHQVAVFDTAFHQTMPETAYLYAIPYSYYKEHGVRRYGFHGTSHYYIATQVAKLYNKPLDQVNVISCHLGNGGSVCAIKGGKSVETSMGLTPLEGLVMGTRSGDLDPAIITWIAQQENKSLEEVNDLLNKQSGLLGITEKSNDARYISDNPEDPRCQLALDVYAHRVAKYIGAYLAILDVDHLDALTFCAGVGENAADFRKAIVDKLGLLGYKLDNDKNNQVLFGKSGPISQAGTPDILVIPTNEELVIAQDTFNLVK